MRLKVAEAVQDDVCKGVVRLDERLMKELGVRPGDIVEITGERATVAIADRAYPGDVGLEIIRMDALTRRNAGTVMCEVVEVRKAEVKEAKSVVIAPAGKGIVVKAPPGIFKQGLLGRALIKGDMVSLGRPRTRRSTTSRPFLFGDIFDMINEDMLGIGFSDIKFIVSDTQPEGVVLITELTEVVFNPEAIGITAHKTPDVAPKPEEQDGVITMPSPPGWLRFHRAEGRVELDRAKLAQMLDIQPEEIKEVELK